MVAVFDSIIFLMLMYWVVSLNFLSSSYRVGRGRASSEWGVGHEGGSSHLFSVLQLSRHLQQFVLHQHTIFSARGI